MLQYDIATLMAIGIIEVLEIINIKHKEICDCTILFLGQIETDELFDGTAIIEGSKFIMLGEVLEMQ